MSTRGPRNHKKPMNHCKNTVVGDYNRSRGSQWGSGTLKGCRNHNGAWYHDGGLGNTRGPGTKMCSGTHIVPQWSSGTKTGTQATQGATGTTSGLMMQGPLWRRMDTTGLGTPNKDHGVVDKMYPFLFNKIKQFVIFTKWRS